MFLRCQVLQLLHSLRQVLLTIKLAFFPNLPVSLSLCKLEMFELEIAVLCQFCQMLVKDHLFSDEISDQLKVTKRLHLLDGVVDSLQGVIGLQDILQYLQANPILPCLYCERPSVFLREEVNPEQVLHCEISDFIIPDGHYFTFNIGVVLLYYQGDWEISMDNLGKGKILIVHYHIYHVSIIEMPALVNQYLILVRNTLILCLTVHQNVVLYGLSINLSELVLPYSLAVVFGELINKFLDKLRDLFVWVDGDGEDISRVGEEEMKEELLFPIELCLCDKIHEGALIVELTILKLLSLLLGQVDNVEVQAVKTVPPQLLLQVFNTQTAVNKCSPRQGKSQHFAISFLRRVQPQVALQDLLKGDRILAEGDHKWVDLFRLHFLPAVE